jgi:hypothetical protein
MSVTRQAFLGIGAGVHPSNRATPAQFLERIFVVVAFARQQSSRYRF